MYSALQHGMVNLTPLCVSDARVMTRNASAARVDPAVRDVGGPSLLECHEAKQFGFLYVRFAALLSPNQRVIRVVNLYASATRRADVSMSIDRLCKFHCAASRHRY